MSKLYIPEGYKTPLPNYELQRAIAFIKQTFQEEFAKALPKQPEPKFYSADGVHPNENGSRFIGKQYFDAIAPLLESLL